jgi:hypothetical protein
MAHFAEVDETNTVLRVVVVSNEDTADEDGNEVESIGAQFCADLFGGTWVQTSYNANMRQYFASPGCTYNATTDEFIPPPPVVLSPFPSWVLDDETGVWEPPTPYPGDQDDNGEPVAPFFTWDENTTSWVEATA